MIDFLKSLSGFALVNFLRSLIPFVLMPLLTRKMSPGGYGTLSLFEVTILILAPLFLCNSHALMSAVYHRVERSVAGQYVYVSMLVTLLLAAITQVLLWAAGDELRQLFEVNDSFYLLIPLFVFARAVVFYVNNVLQLQQRAVPYGVYTIGVTALDLALSILFVVVWNGGYKGRLIGSYTAMFLFGAYGLWALWRQGLINFRYSAPLVTEILRYGLPLVPHALGGVSLAMANRYLIAHALGPSSVGYYSVAYQLASVMLLAGTSINQVWSAWLFRLVSKDLEGNAQTIRRLFFLNVGLMVCAAVVIQLAVNILFAIFVDPKFYAAKTYFPWMLLGFLCQSLYFLFINFDFYDKKVISIGVVTFAVAGVNIWLTIQWLPVFGVMGAAYASAASMALYLVAVMTRVVVLNKTFRAVWQT